MHMKTVLILLVLALATIFALVCVLLTRGRAPGTCQPQPPEQEDTDDGQSLVFADLTPEEMAQVVRYLRGNLGVPLVDASRAKPSDNCIASVDVQVPPKAEVLRFLDGGGARPPREALAVLYFGNQPGPNVTEYVVGPLPTPVYHRDVTVQKYGGKVPYHRRPTLAVEYKQIGAFLKSQVFPTAPSFMRQVMEYDGASLAALTAAPRGFQSGDRITWFVLFQNVSGFFVHPVGLEVLVDHSSLDIARWAVSRVFYNGQYYRDMVQLESAYVQGRISVEKVRKATVGCAVPSPGRAVGMSVNTGLRLFDIRHKGERVAYEISIQEALSVYGSNCPGGMSTRYMDGSFGIGRYTSPLVRGVDCPYLATYLDVHYLAHSQVSRISKNALCIFEQNLGSPLRRHYSNLQSLYYGGLVNSALVVRSIATVGNYDYVWDFIFYQNGAIEGKVQATGYASSSFLHGDGLRYGNRVWEHTLGTVHTHSVNYKVDLDVGEECEVDRDLWKVAVSDVPPPPRAGLGAAGSALQELVAVQEQPPHSTLELCWSCWVPSLGVGRDWEAAESGDGEKRHVEVLEPAGRGLSRSASLDRPFRGAGLVPGRRGAAAVQPAEPVPVASLRSHIRRDGVSGEMLGEAKAPWADRGRGSSWCHPAAEKPISISGSESGAGSPAGSLAVSGVGREQAELDGTCDLFSEPMQAPGALPASQATPLHPQLANELRALSAGEGHVPEPAAEPHALFLHSER
ncbi:PREDICTED: membrane primary amine oxidase-like [Charadrius vociferus]|uniref:membrane primary amine oxidase-like n=1 Tax=Charadrius vociferus TaxID=50402 RepID=UPI000521CA02|nr:PREDICTED: membrane primary amine oxidase-like [Charadrius vociferus]